MSGAEALSHRVSQLPVAAREQQGGGSVVAARELSVRAGQAMFELGGNAVDAAVAAALVAGVIEPAETSLAGSGFVLLHHPQHGAWSVDFGPLAPLGATPDMFEIDRSGLSSNVLGLAPVVDAENVFGPRASGVPRTLLGLLTAHERWGNVSRAHVLAPAIAAARTGMPADSWFLVNAMQDLERLAADPGCREVFLEADGLPRGRRSAAPYGVSVGEPEYIVQPALARTLETVAEEGLTTLTEGSIALELAATFADRGMCLTAADLRRSAPRVERPLTLAYRDHTVAVPQAPGGGLTVLQILAIWQQLHSPADAGALSRAEQLQRLSRVLRHAFADRYHWLGDPEVVPVPAQALLSEEYARQIAEICAEQEWPLDLAAAPWNRFATEALHDPWRFETRAETPQWAPTGGTEPSSGTTHVSAADAEGWVVSITHTAANHFGAAVLCPRTGLLFDSAMAWFNAVPGAANSIAGGARPVANMGPALVLGPQRSVAVGASGGRRIISAVAQLIISLVDRSDAPAAALARPRIDGSGAPIVVHELDAEAAAQVPELGAVVVPHASLPHQLDFARASIAEVDRAGLVRTAIDARAYGA